VTTVKKEKNGDFSLLIKHNLRRWCLCGKVTVEEVCLCLLVSYVEEGQWISAKDENYL